MDISYKELAKRAEISESFATQLLSGARGASLTKALEIYDKTGLQFGILKGLSASAIKELRPRAAA